MAYDTTNAISEQFTLLDVHARIVSYLSEDIKDKLKPGQITNAIKQRMMHVYNMAYSEMKDSYRAQEAGVAVAAGEVDVSGIDFLRDVVGVSESGKPYMEAVNFKELDDVTNGARGTENDGTRMFYYLRRQKKIRLEFGTGATAPASVTVQYISLPMTNFTQAELEDDSNYIDLPDEWVNYVIVGAAYDLSASERERMSPQLRDDHTSVVQAIDARFAALRTREKVTHED